MSDETLNLKDVEAIIRDGVSKAVAEAMVDSTRKATEEAERARKEGKNAEVLAQVAEKMKGEHERAKVDSRTLEVIHDPHKGKGLRFARAVKALGAAKHESCAPKEMARRWANQGHRQYAEIADLLEQAERDTNSPNRALNESTFAQGGSLVPIQESTEFIELLYAATLALKLGARTMEFNGSVAMGRLNSGATVFYVGEADNITPSQPGVGEIRMSRKKAAAVVPITNELLRNPSVGADAIVRDDLVNAMALRRDLSFFRGIGSTGQPKGMAFWLNQSLNKFAQSANTAAGKIADLVKLIRLVDESNVPLVSGGFAMSPRSLWSLASTVDANSNLVFAAMINQGMLFGFPFGRSTQIPNNLGGGSDSEVYFGAFNDAILGFDVGTPFTVEVFINGAFFDGSTVVSGISSDQSVIRALEGHDVSLRHDQAFAQLTGVQWT